MDWRILIIEYIQRHPLFFSILGTSIICSTGIVGLVFELYNNTCVDDVKLWLLVCVLRLLCRLVLRIYIEAISQRWISFHGSILLLHKIIDIVDVFGFVWFAVGNLLVFNNIECAKSSPIVFSTSVAYLGLTYLSVMIPSFIRCSLSCYPPASIDDRMYLLNLNAFDLRSGRDARGALYGVNQELGANLTPDETQYWKNWLAQHGCEEFVFNAEAFPKLLTHNKHEGDVTEGKEDDARIGVETGVDDRDAISLYDLEHQPPRHSPKAPMDTKGAGLNQSAAAPSLSFSEALLDRVGGDTGIADGTHGSDVEQPTCAICLMVFEEPASVVASGDENVDRAGGVCPGQEGAPRRHHLAADGDGDGEEGAGDANENSANGNANANEANNSVIVRYPCSNDHFFHAHCLKSWLQVSNNRGGNQFITCPCCRQTPISLNNNPNPTPRTHHM